MSVAQDISCFFVLAFFNVDESHAVLPGRTTAHVCIGLGLKYKRSEMLFPSKNYGPAVRLIVDLDYH